MKLTHPQRLLLFSLPKRCIDTYAPMKALVKMGLATYRPLSWGHGTVEITELGTKMKKELERKL